MKLFLLVMVMAILSPVLAQESEEAVEPITVSGSRVVQKANPELVMVLLEAFEYGNLELEDDDELVSAMRSLILSSIINEEAIISERQNALWFNKIASNVAFFVAHILLVIGFFIGIKEYRRIKEIQGVDSISEEFEITLGVESIALKATMGALLSILFCFGFYFLYLVLVFPIVSI